MEKTNFVMAVCLTGLIMSIHQVLKLIETLTTIIFKNDIIPVWNGSNLLQFIIWFVVFVVFLKIYNKMDEED